MKPEIVGKILNMPVLEPSDPLIISDHDAGSARIVVKHGLVGFGSKCAFLGCPMFHENRAYSEGVLLTVIQDGDADLDVILEGPEVIGALIEALTAARDKMVGWDARYDQIVGYERIWDAAQDDMREEMKETFAASIEVPDGFVLCPDCVGVKHEGPCHRCQGERIVKASLRPDNCDHLIVEPDEGELR